MIVKVINITSYVGISGGAEHYYAEAFEVETDKNVNELIELMPSYLNTEENKLQRVISTEREAKHLRLKDNYKGWRVGKKTERFNSRKEIRAVAAKMFPTHNIIFVYDHENSTDPEDIIDRTVYEFKKTGRQIQINGFEGFSREFDNLTEESIHDIIETPEKYKHKSLHDGYWVMGVSEPVLVLINECDVL